MPEDKTSLWKRPLIREIAVILALKLVILLGIKAVWFPAPTVPVDGTAKTDLQFFGPAAASPTASPSAPEPLR